MSMLLAIVSIVRSDGEPQVPPVDEDVPGEVVAFREGLSKATLEKMNFVVSRRRGLSQSKVERLTGISQGTISEILSGKQRAFADQLIAIAGAAGVSLDWMTNDERGPEDVCPPGHAPASVGGFLLWLVDRLPIPRDEAIRILSSEESVLADYAPISGPEARTITMVPGPDSRNNPKPKQNRKRSKPLE